MSESFDWVGHVTLAQAAGTLAALGAFYALGRKIFPWVRDLVYFLDDITGRKARHGQYAQPGLLERQCNVERTLSRQDESLRQITATLKELKPNGGASIKDQLTRVDEGLNTTVALVQTVQVAQLAMQSTYDAHALHSAQAEAEMRADILKLKDDK